MLRRDFVKAGILVPSLGLGVNTHSNTPTIPNVYKKVYQRDKLACISTKVHAKYNAQIFNEPPNWHFHVTNRATGHTQLVPWVQSFIRTECKPYEFESDIVDRVEKVILNRVQHYNSYPLSIVMSTFIYYRLGKHYPPFIQLLEPCIAATRWNAIIERGDELLFESDLLLNKV